MLPLHITLFGSIELLIDGRPVTLAYDKVRALLAYLLIEAKRPQRRESLAGLLWPEQMEKEARHSLSQALLKLRQAIDPDRSVVLANRHTVQLNPDANIELDTAAFTTHLHHCQIHRHAQPTLCASCMAHRETAVSLYKGPFLAGLSVPDAPQFEQWLTQQREHYHRQVMNALATLTTYHEQRGELTVAIQYAQRQLAFEPWLEETHYQLMRLLLYNGQRSSALAQYLNCVQVLDEELGVEPSPQTAALFKLIQTADPHPPHNLPTASTPLVGREAETAQLTSWLAARNSRLITIVGPGGMGKTRLALSVAQMQLGRPTDEATEADTYAFYTDGVFWVTLTGVTAATGLVPAVAEAVGLQLDSGESGFRPRSVQQQLIGYLQEKRLLLVLDNFEQLLVSAEAASSTAIIHQIVHQAPNIQLLVTSRERLQIQEEQLFLLDGLAYPTTDERPLDSFAALALFKGAAKRVQPQLFENETDLATIATVCRLLEGSPLAIELAASNLNVLAPSDILASLEESLTLLATNNRHVPERHRSMQAAFVTSWQRLTPELQEAIAKLSIFQNGFTLTAAKAVADTNLHLLTGLINHSLLRFDPHLKRYYSHELLRQFAAEELTRFSPDLQTAVHTNHATYFLRIFAQHEEALKGAQQLETLLLLEQEIDNTRSAWRWACQHQPHTLLPAIHSISLFYERLGRHLEGVELCDMALATMAASSDDKQTQLIKGRLWAWNGRFLAAQYQWAKCQQALSASARLLEPLDSDVDTAFLNLQQCRFHWRDDKKQAKQLAQRALDLATHAQDQWLMAEAHNLLGRMARTMSQFRSAQHHLAQSLAIRQTIQDHSGLAHTLSHLSLALMDIGELEQAEAYANKGLSIYQQINDLPNIANICNSLGLIYFFSGHFEKADQQFTESMTILKRIGLSSSTAMTQLWLDAVSIATNGNYDTIYSSQLAIYESYKTKKVNRVLAYASLGLALTGIGAERFDDALEYATHGVICFEQLGQIKEAAECSAFKAIAALGKQDLLEAERHLQIYGRFIIESRTFFSTILTMTLLVLVDLCKGEHKQAIVKYTVLQSIPYVANNCWYADVLGRPVQVAINQLAPAEVEKARAGGRQLDLWETAAAALQGDHL